MARTVNQVLDIAELESFVVATDARADLHEVCADAVGFMAPLAVDRGQDHRADRRGGPGVGARPCRGAVPCRAQSGRERHPPHAAGVSIEVEVSDDGAVRVLDDGPGVPEADRESIFRRFWRRDRADGESRGLGLAIVARVAEAHDGSVTVEDRPGGGVGLHAAAATSGQLTAPIRAVAR